jgi:hypothetical protein
VRRVGGGDSCFAFNSFFSLFDRAGSGVKKSPPLRVGVFLFKFFDTSCSELESSAAVWDEEIEDEGGIGDLHSSRVESEDPYQKPAMVKPGGELRNA